MSRKITPLGWLLLRPGCFLAAQAGIAVAVLLTGTPDAWTVAAGWWPIAAIAVNLIMLMGVCLRAWSAYRTCFRIEPSSFCRDGLGALAVILLSFALVSLCNAIGMRLLFGESADPMDRMFQPLPMAARWAVLLLMPVTVAAFEMPWYYGILRDRMSEAGWPVWGIVAAGGIAFSIQHAALPCLPDLRFLAWRGLMMLPFTLLLAAALQARPRWMPFFMAAHFLVDLTFAGLIFSL